MLTNPFTATVHEVTYLRTVNGHNVYQVRTSEGTYNTKSNAQIGLLLYGAELRYAGMVCTITLSGRGTITDMEPATKGEIWLLRDPRTGVPQSAWADREALAEFLRSEIERGLREADITRFTANDPLDPGIQAAIDEITGDDGE